MISRSHSKCKNCNFVIFQSTEFLYLKKIKTKNLALRLDGSLLSPGVSSGSMHNNQLWFWGREERGGGREERKEKGRKEVGNKEGRN